MHTYDDDNDNDGVDNGGSYGDKIKGDNGDDQSFGHPRKLWGQRVELSRGGNN